MNKFNKHHLMDVKEVCEYVKIKYKLFKPEEELFCEEIGDGNINYIFYVNFYAKRKICCHQTS